ncbi:Sex comb on midleg-like protein 4 [Saguinus oedipus]|uniref:Sex comb on midleg-like protein 4 n=1 Tax=Saguinus oedipus TaxID=9490 RepID=A0ABQ9VXP5_SAGOE|nr:Sex comb on midleg-like protein 4 [Saguinus oedipus]
MGSLLQIKSRVLMTPLALSPPRSTPEPDLSSIPQDAATVPSLAAPQALTEPGFWYTGPSLLTLNRALVPVFALPDTIPPQSNPLPSNPVRGTVCLYINKQANAGPYLERKKVQQLPEHFGPERPSAVLQQAVQACIDCAHQQKLVFSLVKQGYGGEMVSVSASFDGKQHLRSLPVVNSVGYVLRFLAKLCRSLLCDDLFSHQPFPRGCSAAEKAQEKEEGRMESDDETTSHIKADGFGLEVAENSPVQQEGRVSSKDLQGPPRGEVLPLKMVQCPVVVFRGLERKRRA